MLKHEKVIWLKASVSIKCALVKWSRLHASLGPFGSPITYTVLTLKAKSAPDHILANKTNLLPQVHPVLAMSQLVPLVPIFRTKCWVSL